MSVRLVLLLVSAIFIGAIAVSSIRHRRRIKFQQKFMKEEFQGSQEDRPVEFVEKNFALYRDSPIAFFIMARNQTYFSGVELIQALLDVGMQHGSRGVFAYSDETDKPLFHVLSAQEPGNFDLVQLELLSVPGLCMVLNTEHSNLIHAFNMMMKVSNELADRLEAIILDSHKEPCQQEFLEQCRLEILELSRQRTESLVTF